MRGAGNFVYASYLNTNAVLLRRPVKSKRFSPSRDEMKFPN